MGSPARCCTRRNICSSMRRPRRSTKPRRRHSIGSSRRSCRQPPSYRSVTAARLRPSISAMSCWPATAIDLRCRTRAGIRSRHNGSLHDGCVGLTRPRLAAGAIGADIADRPPGERSIAAIPHVGSFKKKKGRQISLPPLRSQERELTSGWPPRSGRPRAWRCRQHRTSSNLCRQD